MRTTSELRALQALLLGARADPIVLLSQSPETLQVVLDPGEVRRIVGPGTRIYYLPGERLLRQLKTTLGRGLALHRGASRIYWPDLSPRSDPEEHPLVPVLDGELERDALLELARSFDLSRPHVRREIALIEDARALLAHQLDTAIQEAREIAQDLRDAKIERHEALTRAEAAERRLDGHLD